MVIVVVVVVVVVVNTEGKNPTNQLRSNSAEGFFRPRCQEEQTAVEVAIVVGYFNTERKNPTISREIKKRRRTFLTKMSRGAIISHTVTQPPYAQSLRYSAA